MRSRKLEVIQRFLEQNPDSSDTRWGESLTNAESLRTDILQRGQVLDPNVFEDRPTEYQKGPATASAIPLLNDLVSQLRAKDVTAAREAADALSGKLEHAFR